MSTTADAARTGLDALLRDEGTPLIAVSFSDAASDRDISSAVDAGLDVAELRIDRYSSFDPDHVVGQAQRFGTFPTIATIRSEAEGGEWRGSEADRMTLFDSVIPEVDCVDIELASEDILPGVVQAAHDRDRLVIISSHDFAATPSGEELSDTARRAKDLGADLVKVAAMAHSARDLRTLAAFTLDNADLGLIVIAMGPHGTASRVFFPALGSRLTYAYVSHPVPGQLSFEDTLALLRRFYPELVRETREMHSQQRLSSLAGEGSDR